MKAKVILAVAILCFVGAVAAHLCVGPVIKFLVKKQLQNIFPYGTVTIGTCRIEPFKAVILSDIAILNGPAYSLKVHQAGIRLAVSFLAIRKHLFIDGVRVAVASGSGTIGDLAQQVRLPHGNSTALLLPDSIELTDCVIRVLLRDLNLESEISALIRVGDLSVESCSFRLGLFSGFGVKVSNALFSLPAGSSRGALNAEELSYNQKVKIKSITGSMAMKDRRLVIDSLTAAMFGGIVSGRAEIDFSGNPTYTVQLHTQAIDSELFVSDFDLGEKVKMTGQFDGDFALVGQGQSLTALSGGLSASGPGGTLSITDTNYLKSVGKQSGQPADILIESFRNYIYNTGRVSIGLDKGNISVAFEFDGRSGKRNLVVTAHDFIKKGELR